ncbi:tripartite tricarboxylate transporter substrate binding protein [Pigmentiphaga soli]|uniref:Tripartite tricarboxylate transporter substrate binding protein n=1 Tax=Pigmentiphaga soli TaxID=1007095 RepID=A0ABP8H3Z6_9BURK
MAIPIRSRQAFFLGAALSLAAACLPAHAQEAAWPTRPVTYVSPYPAGTPVDLIARRVGQCLQPALGQPFIVENRAGAGGVIGTTYVAKAAPDGYTLVEGSLGTHAINAGLYPKLDYDPIKDFAPVALIGATPLVLVVNTKNLPVKTVQEFVAYAKAHPGAIRVGSSGNGSSLHLTGQLFKSMTNIDFVHVPYKGSGPAMTDLLGGQIDAMFDNSTNVLPQVKTGKLRALAVTGDRRIGSIPDVPTVAETVAPGYSVATWHAVLAPAGTPKPIIDKLSTAILNCLAQPAEKQFYEGHEIQLQPGGPEQLRALLEKEVPKWKAIVKESGATVD